MKVNWLACAAATACLATPALAQTDATVVVSAPGASAGMTDYTNVDMAEVRGYMDDLRDYINQMRVNNDLAFSASDAVHQDAYRRSNKILLDNASGLAMNADEELGPPTRIPPGLGAARDYIAMVVNHLAHARMMADYGTPIDQAKMALDNAYEALDRSNMAMSGSNMPGTGMSGTVTTETPTTETPTTETPSTDSMGTDMNTTTPGTTEPDSSTTQPDSGMTDTPNTTPGY